MMSEHISLAIGKAWIRFTITRDWQLNSTTSLANDLQVARMLLDRIGFASLVHEAEPVVSISGHDAPDETVSANLIRCVKTMWRLDLPMPVTLSETFHNSAAELDLLTSSLGIDPLSGSPPATAKPDGSAVPPAAESSENTSPVQNSQEPPLPVDDAFRFFAGAIQGGFHAIRPRKPAETAPSRSFAGPNRFAALYTAPAQPPGGAESSFADAPGSPESASPAHPNRASSEAVREMVATVRAHVQQHGSAPEFQSEKVSVRERANNFIRSVTARPNAPDAVVDAVRSELARLAVAKAR
jgi:hypothetical protein